MIAELPGMVHHFDLHTAGIAQRYVNFTSLFGID